MKRTNQNESDDEAEIDGSGSEEEESDTEEDDFIAKLMAKKKALAEQRQAEAVAQALAAEKEKAAAAAAAAEAAATAAAAAAKPAAKPAMSFKEKMMAAAKKEKETASAAPTSSPSSSLSPSTKFPTKPGGEEKSSEMQRKPTNGFASLGKAIAKAVHEDKLDEQGAEEGGGSRESRITRRLTSALSIKLSSEKITQATKKMHERVKRSGLGKFLYDTGEDVKCDDFDLGVNAMALLCALVLTIPYQLMACLGYVYLDWVEQRVKECENEPGSPPNQFEIIYAGIRSCTLLTIYMAISGMILSTFYFLFKRTNQDQYVEWRPKARILVSLIFVATAMAICGLISLTNLAFNYFLLPTDANLCHNGTTSYITPGIVVAFLAFVLGMYLIY